MQLRKTAYGDQMPPKIDFFRKQKLIYESKVKEIEILLGKNKKQ